MPDLSAAIQQSIDALNGAQPDAAPRELPALRWDGHRYTRYGTGTWPGNLARQPITQGWFVWSVSRHHLGAETQVGMPGRSGLCIHTNIDEETGAFSYICLESWRHELHRLAIATDDVFEAEPATTKDVKRLVGEAYAALGAGRSQYRIAPGTSAWLEGVLPQLIRLAS
jgi:hypothetical protein